MAEQLDAALDELEERRGRVLADWSHPRRSEGLAALYELEAAVWAEVFEHTRVRLYWRAALAAEAYARHCARHWSANEVPNVARLREVVELDGDGSTTRNRESFSAAQQIADTAPAGRGERINGGERSWM